MVPNIPSHLLNFSYTHPYSLTTSFYHLKLPNSYPLPPRKLCFLSSCPLGFACQLLIMEGNKKPYNKEVISTFMSPLQHMTTCLHHFSRDHSRDKSFVTHRDNLTSKFVSEIRKMNWEKVKEVLSIIDQVTKTSFSLYIGVMI